MTALRGERITRVAPLGVRFWDQAVDGPVTAGLVVAAEPETGGPRRVAPAPHGTVHVLRGLPGLTEDEAGDGTPAYWAALPPQRRFRIAVDDARGRFLPTAFTVDLPHRRVLTDPCGTAPQARGVPLFSAPGRIAPPGRAALRADLWDVDVSRPAAHAVLDVLVGAVRLGRGVADHEGHVLVAFPWPATPATLTPAAALARQRWTLTLALRYRRATVPPRPPDRPTVCATLAQPGADLLDVPAPLELTYGRELVVSSTTSSEKRLLCRPIP